MQPVVIAGGKTTEARRAVRTLAVREESAGGGRGHKHSLARIQVPRRNDGAPRVLRLFDSDRK